MKRSFLLLIAFILMAALISGCGRNADRPEGRYVVKTIAGEPVEKVFTEMLENFGDGMTLDDLLRLYELDSIEEFMVIDLKEDGTALLSLSGMEDNTGTWVQRGDKIIITVDGEDTVFTRMGNELSFHEGVQDYVFSKK